MITIITPTFNQSEFIKDTFNCIRSEKSVLKDKLKYIVVDANSTDNTQAYVNENKDIIDIYIRESDKGQYEAIQKGIKLCNTKFVNWLNSDDYLLPKTLQLLEYFTQLNLDFDIISFSNLNSYKDGGIFNGWGKYGRRKWQYEFKDIFKGTIIFSQESTFVSKRFLDSNSIDLLPNFRNCFDHLFYMSILKNNPKILLVDVIGGVMRVHNDSITVNGSTLEDYLIKEKKVREIIGWRSYFFRRVYHNFFTKWFFQIYLLCIKLNFHPSFLSVFSISKIAIAEKNGFDLMNNDSWKIKTVYSKK